MAAILPYRPGYAAVSTATVGERRRCLLANFVADPRTARLCRVFSRDDTAMPDVGRSVGFPGMLMQMDVRVCARSWQDDGRSGKRTNTYSAYRIQASRSPSSRSVCEV